MTLLTQEEWTALQRFYAGEPARNIRKDYPGIWGLVAQLRNRPDANTLIAQLKRKVRIKLNDIPGYRPAKPDPELLDLHGVPHDFPSVYGTERPDASPLIAQLQRKEDDSV